MRTTLIITITVMGLVGALRAGPTLLNSEDLAMLNSCSGFDNGSFVSDGVVTGDTVKPGAVIQFNTDTTPQKFMLVNSSGITKLQISDKVVMFKGLNRVDGLSMSMFAPQQGFVSVSDFKFNNGVADKQLNGFTLTDGRNSAFNLDNLPDNFVLKGTVTNKFGNGNSSMTFVFNDSACGSGSPVSTPAPGAILLAASGILIVGWLRRKFV